MKKRLMRWLERPLTHKLRSIGLHIAQALSGCIAAVFTVAKKADNRLFRSAMFRTLKVRPFALAGASRETFIVITSDDTISRSVYVEGGFEFEKLQKVVSLLGPGFRVDTLIDIGA